MRKRGIAFLFLLPILSSVALANRTLAALSGPDSVAVGTEVTITISISHKGNSASHYTNWVWVKADGKEIARWEFDASRLPESENFTREVKFTVVKAVEITAQGNCIRHGSRGPAVLKIGLK
jgi:desulfoferrodoxin (superoxide reductase-like protein)